jgi:hypothetical protein
MQGFKSAGGAKFLSFHAAAYYIFNVQRHLISACTHRAFRNTWRTAVAAARYYSRHRILVFFFQRCDNAQGSPAEFEAIRPLGANEHKSTNLGVGSSNLSGRANKITKLHWFA